MIKLRSPNGLIVTLECWCVFVSFVQFFRAAPLPSVHLEAVISVEMMFAFLPPTLMQTTIKGHQIVFRQAVLSKSKVSGFNRA